MNKKRVHTPEGVRDVYGTEYGQRSKLKAKLNKVFASYGYEGIRTPGFEFFDVFNSEKGTVSAREMFRFFDREGNTLVLRPDVTPSIARCIAKYFNEEKAVYEQLLANPGEVVSGTVKELAEKYNMELKYMVGFLDGINESLKTPNPIEDMDENTQVSLDIDLEQLYYHMVEAKADWLYELPAWDELLTPERRKELYMEQKKSGTIVKEKKVGRNDPCPCGSGKKYKFCCGRK